MPRYVVLLITLAGLLVSFGSVQAAPVYQATSIADPFTYCATVGTIGKPDARYSGPAVPETIVRGLMRAMAIPEGAPVAPNVHLTTWRCMNGQVYACNYGANIPCDEQAVTTQVPTSAVEDYCKANANSDFIPAVVTGRATVYAWGCVNGAPVISKQIDQPDAAGFLSSFWYQISPTATLPTTGGVPDMMVQLLALSILCGVVGLSIRRRFSASDAR